MRTITRKGFIRLAASAGAGGLLLGGLPARRASAHAGMPSYITNALEHQTYDMFQGWFSWLRSVGVPGYLGEHSVPNSQKPLGASEVQKWLTLFDKASVVEAHPPVPGSLRGMNTSSGAVTQIGFSRSSPGTYGGDYIYPDQEDFKYLRNLGHNVTRIPFRWERVQPQLNGPLKSVELARLKSCFDA